MSPAQSPVSQTLRLAAVSVAEAPAAGGPAAATAVAAPPAEGPPPPSLALLDPEGPPLQGDSSSRVLAAFWQAASCRVLDLAAGEAQRRRISPFSGLVMEVRPISR